MQALSDQVGQTPDTEQIVGGGQQQRFVAVQPLSGDHFLRHRREGRIDEAEIVDGTYHSVIILATRSLFNSTRVFLEASVYLSCNEDRNSSLVGNSRTFCNRSSIAASGDSVDSALRMR